MALLPDRVRVPRVSTHRDRTYGGARLHCVLAGANERGLQRKLYARRSLSQDLDEGLTEVLGLIDRSCAPVPDDCVAGPAQAGAVIGVGAG